MNREQNGRNSNTNTGPGENIKQITHLMKQFLK